MARSSSRSKSRAKGGDSAGSRRSTASSRASAKGGAAGKKRGSGGGRGSGGLKTGVQLLGLMVLFLSFGAGLVAAIYSAKLDRIVRERFEGQPFRVPSRVFTAPTILYPGIDWKLADLQGTLQRLGFREALRTQDLPMGQYVWGRDRVRIHVPPFAHPSRPEPERDVVLRLKGRLVEEIRALPSGREMGALLLEAEQVGAFYGADREQRELVRLDDVPEHLVAAILAVEDQRFESHPGIDVKRIVGAMLANLRAGTITQGGSTLTQQLVKNFFLTPERTFARKAQEALMALIVEARYEKREILQAYLNEIYFGQRGSTAIHGVGEATRLYFGKSTRELTVSESALLAAIIHSPNGTSPYREPERARERRDLVLDLMHSQGRLGDAELEQARAQPLQLAKVTPDRGDARYFLDLLHRQLSQLYAPDALTTEGLRIYSTLDRRLQRIAADAMSDGLAELEKKYPALRSDDPLRRLQGCLVAMRPQTGELLALVGGRDYGDSQFDRCTQARRPAGSIFKPFVFIAALEPVGGGMPAITLASFLDDSEFEVSTPSGPWKPQNFDHRYHDIVPVREALEHSYNAATARLASEVGVRRVADVARRLGITSELPLVPSLALGTADVSPLEIARAYATIASGGIRPEIQAIEDVVDAAGQTLERRQLRFERVLDAGTAHLATSLLEGVALRGTAAGIRSSGLTGPVAGKTGTTDDEHDLWFVGFTPELVAVVWVGFDEPRSVGVPSSRGALPIWRRFVTEATGGHIRGAFLRPREVESVDIEPATGALALSGCPARRSELFLRGTLPDAICPSGAVRGEGPARSVQRRFVEWLRNL